ncbi:hypothetical protein ACEPAF_3018 [Sanghuangporus sanghuang]
MWYMCVAPGQALGSVDLTSAWLFASAYDYKISECPIRILILTPPEKRRRQAHTHPSIKLGFVSISTHAFASTVHTSPALLPLLIRRALSFGTLFDRDRPSARALHSLPSDAWGQLNRLPSGNRKTMAGLQPPAPAPVPAAPSLSLEPESFIDLGPDSPVLRPRAESKAKKRLRIAVASTFTSASACSSPSSDCSSSAAASSSSSSSSPPSLPRLVPLSPLSAFSFTLSPASETGTSYIQSDEDSDIDPDPDPDSDLDSETEFEAGDEDDSGDDSDTDVGDDESSFVKGYTEDLDEDEDGVGSEQEGGGEEEEEEVMSMSTNIRSHPYRYRLLPALSMPRFTPGPSSMYAPCPYTFKKGDVAFALTREGTRTWRRVTVLDNGLLSSFASSIPRKTEPYEPAKPSEPQSRPFYQSPNPVLKAINYYYHHAPPPRPPPSPSSPALVYTAQWPEPDPSSPAQTRTMLGSFCPTRGTLKPDDKHTRRLLLLEEGCTLIE